MSGEKPDVGILRVRLDEMYAKSKALYYNPGELKDTPDYSGLEGKIANLIAQISDAESKKKKEDQLTYYAPLGIFIPWSEIEGTNAWLERLAGYEKRKPGEKIGEQEKADYERLARVIEYPIGGTQWLNTKQVEAYTGLKVIIGTDALKQHLQSDNKNEPFVYLIEGEGGQNHFICIIPQGNNKFLIVDSNGDLLPGKERGVLPAGAKVSYIGRDGDLLSEDAARDNPENIKRFQFDNHNCGVFASKCAKTWNDTKGNLGKTIAAMDAVTNDPAAARAEYSAVMRQRAHEIRHSVGSHDKGADAADDVQAMLMAAGGGIVSMLFAVAAGVVEWMLEISPSVSNAVEIKPAHLAKPNIGITPEHDTEENPKVVGPHTTTAMGLNSNNNATQHGSLIRGN